MSGVIGAAWPGTLLRPFPVEVYVFSDGCGLLLPYYPLSLIACVWEDSQMKLALELIACWVVFSCAAVPVLTWAFFRTERVARDKLIAGDILTLQRFVEAWTR
jgi:hypothetical protein